MASSANSSPSYHGSAYGAVASQAATTTAAAPGAGSPPAPASRYGSRNARASSTASSTSSTSEPARIHDRYPPGPNRACSQPFTSAHGVASDTISVARETWSSTYGPASR
nr:MAG: hypothetical protein DIU60_24715 [Actinomycetota bacterium]